MTPEKLTEAVKAAGGPTAVAAQVGVTRQAVWNWTKKGQVPLEYIPAVEAALGVSRYDLRPDYFGDRGEG